MFGMDTKEMRSKFFLAIILLTPIVVTISAHLYFQKVLQEGPYSQKTRENGDFFGASDESEMNILNSYRDRLNKGEPVLLELCKELNLKLAVDRLAYVSHWVTPKMEMKRYSTRFFIALAPDDQDAIHDGSEGVESTWISPEEALQKGEEGSFPIILPTIKNLESIIGFSDTHSLLKNKVNYQNEVSSIEPKFFMENGKLVGLLPGDIGYEDH